MRGTCIPRWCACLSQIGTSVSTVESAVGALAAKGEQALLMAEFYGTIPSTSQAQSLADWAHAVGPGGTFWLGGSDGDMAVRDIEFGNETNESYQFGGVGSGPSYTTRAQNYALRAKDATDAIASSRGQPECRPGRPGRQRRLRLLAVGRRHVQRGARPNKRIAGWTIHPYGPKSRYGPIMDQAVRDTAKHGDTTLPFFITEYGISTNNGQCLDSNYNWPTCLTYQQAADAPRGDRRHAPDLRRSPCRVPRVRAARHGYRRRQPRGQLRCAQERRLPEGCLHDRDPQRAEHLPRLIRAASRGPSGASSTCWMRRTTLGR